MRRWKVIEGNDYVNSGDVVTLHHNCADNVPAFWTPQHDDFRYCCLWRLVEIDENGNTIRTYKEGDTLNGGTVVDKKQQALERLAALESEAKALREIIKAPDKIVYDRDKIFVAQNRCGEYILLGCNNVYAFYKLTDAEFRYSRPFRSGQEAIDYMLKDNSIITVFNTKKEALEFMLEGEK